jgi:hypothetical protein
MARTQKKPDTPQYNAPDFLAWHVIDKGEKSYWNKVGAACLPRHRVNFATIVDGNKAAPITARQHEAAFLEGLGEGHTGIRAIPAFLKQRLYVFGIEANAPRLLPFLARVAERIALLPVAQPLRHFPAMRAEQFA